MSKAPSDLRIIKIVAANLQHLLDVSEKKQKDIQKATGIPMSTINSYFLGVHLPSAGNLQKISDFFGVKKSEIDPRYAPNHFLAQSLDEVDLYRLWRGDADIYYKGNLLDDEFFDMILRQAQYYTEAKKYQAIQQKKDKN